MLASSKSSNLHKILYALPAFVLALPTIPVFILLPTFYAESLGLGLATVGGAFFMLRLLDVISDPLLGWISDAMPVTLGKRKLPMAVGGLIGAPSIIMFFSPNTDITVWYLLIWGGLLYVSWTAIQIPYITWAVELDSDYTERSKLNGIREGFGLLGIMAIGAAGYFLANISESERFKIIAWGTVCIGILIFFISLYLVPQGRVSAEHRSKSFTLPKNNKLFLRVLFAWFINGFANGLPAVCLPLFLNYIIGANEEDKASMLLIYFSFAVIGIMGWVKLAALISKHRAWCISMVSACIVFLFVPFLSSGDIFAFGVICALTGLTLGSDLALPPAIQGDCADWDQLRFNKNRTATLFSYWSMATKLALGLAIGTAFPTLAYFGLSEENSNIPEKALTALVVIYAVIPIVLKLISVLVMWNFPITQKRHKAIQSRLERN